MIARPRAAGGVAVAVIVAAAALLVGSMLAAAPTSWPPPQLPARASMRTARTVPGACASAIDPELAGSAGSTQDTVKPVNPAKTLAAVRALRPPGKELVLRVNRLFESAGTAGIRRFRRIIAAYTRAGFDTELQVRYHPSAAQAGNIAAWTRYVRRVVDVFGPNRHVVAMTITNEINLAISPNTSDGAYPRAEQALIRGDHRRPP